jgi:hypothetical protein
MKNTNADIEFLKETYIAARNRYKPRHIKVLLIVEAPPDSLDRFFYFEDVKKQDSLFLEIMGILYPDQKAEYLASGRDTELKKELLQAFRTDGFWLMDLSEVPLSISGNSLESCVPHLLERLNKYIDKTTPVVIIKTNVYDLCYSVLRAEGYNVVAERMPFPGSGQQRIFREKFRTVVDWR